MNLSEAKAKIIKEIQEYEKEHISTQYILSSFGNADLHISRQAFAELEKDELIYIQKGRMFVSLTKSGKRAASIGYNIYENEIEEEAKQAITDAKLKTKLELKSLQFNNTWKWTIIAGFIMSVVSFLISILKK